MKQSIQGQDGDPAANLVTRLAALSHPARLEILRHLAREQCCCKDVVRQLDLAQSTVSQHLKVLVEAGLVHHETDRQRSIYRIDPAAMADVSRGVSGLVEACCRGGAGDASAK
jgi:ArsR family transcriptional regulator